MDLSQEFSTADYSKRCQILSQLDAVITVAQAGLGKWDSNKTNIQARLVQIRQLLNDLDYSTNQNRDQSNQPLLSQSSISGPTSKEILGNRSSSDNSSINQKPPAIYEQSAPLDKTTYAPSPSTQEKNATCEATGINTVHADRKSGPVPGTATCETTGINAVHADKKFGPISGTATCETTSINAVHADNKCGPVSSTASNSSTTTDSDEHTAKPPINNILPKAREATSQRVPPTSTFKFQHESSDWPTILSWQFV